MSKEKKLTECTIYQNKKKSIITLAMRILSLLIVTIMLATVTVGCKDDDKYTSSLTTTADDTITSSDEELTIEDSIESNTNNEESNVKQSNDASSNDNEVNSNSNSNTISNNSSNNNRQNNSNDSTTHSTSTPSVSTPVETPPVLETPEVTMPAKLTADNINDIEVFNHFAQKIYINYSADITNIGYWYNNEVYWADINDHRFLILLFNSDYINQSTYNAFFQSQTIDDINRMSNFVSGILNFAGKADLNINFDKIVIDNNKKEFLELLQSAMKNGNLKQFVTDFFNGNQKYFNYQDDYLMDYFVNMAGYNLLSDEDINSVNLLNYYFDIQDQTYLYMNNLYHKYNE